MKTMLCIVLGFVSIAHITAQQEDALLLYRQGQFSRAIEVCLQELDSRDVSQSRLRMNSYTVLGWSYIRLGQYQKALQTAISAHQEIRNDIRIVEIEGEALYYLGRNIEALDRFEKYIALNKNSTGDRIDLVHYFMGEIFLRLAEYNHADIAFSAALHYSPQVAQWWVKLGYAREQIPDIQGAQSAYSQALQLQPSLQDAIAGLERVSG